MPIIRAYQLKEGDVFIRQGVKHIVRHISDGKIHHQHLSDTGVCKKFDGSYNVIGAKSQERVELVYNAKQ